MRKLDPANLKLAGSLLVLVFLIASIAVIVRLTPQQRPTQPKAASSVTLLPSRPGSYASWSRSGCSENYDCVNEPEGGISGSDGDSTHVYLSVQGATYTEFYGLSASGIPAGSIINSVRLYSVARVDSGSSSLSLMVFTRGNGYQLGSSEVPVSSSYSYQSSSTNSNPAGGAWTVDDINNLEIGIRNHLTSVGSWVTWRVSKVGVDINYTPPSCNNECSASGAKQCAGNNQFQTCGNYDADSCLEWSSATSCPPGQTCSGSGVCSTSGGGTSGGGTKTGGGTKSGGITGTLTNLQLTISVPYLIGNMNISVKVGSVSKEVEFSPDKKDYSLDVKEANISIGSSITVVVGGNKTLIKKIQVTPSTETTAVNVGDLTLGDITGDNKIDDKDAVSFLDSITKQTLKGDFNADKITNSLDWAILLVNFGKSGDL